MTKDDIIIILGLVLINILGFVCISGCDVIAVTGSINEGHLTTY